MQFVSPVVDMPVEVCTYVCMYVCMLVVFLANLTLSSEMASNYSIEPDVGVFAVAEVPPRHADPGR